MDYDLTRLGSRVFEQLCQSLVLKLLGPRVVIFGDGPDGGREATFHGRSVWTASSETEVWDGYQVLQAKFRARPLGTSQDQRWFLTEVKRELKRWADPKSNRNKKSRLPEYLLLATNVTLSATEGGGVDAVHELVEQFAEPLGLKGLRVWHYDQIGAHLDDATDIRRAYAGLITPGDVLAKLHELLQGDVADLGETLAAHGAKDLLAERWVRLGQAGSAANDKLTLDQVAVDLPARRTVGDAPVTMNAVAHIVRHGDQVLRRSIVSDQIAPHVVLVGGPGQGKTTLGQLITQAYRVALLEPDPGRHGRPVAETVEATRRALADQGIPTPVNQRWPIRVDLAAYGDEVGGGQQISLLRWISTLIESRASVTITPNQLSAWLKSWPWLLVLDGLDEVASPHARTNLMDRISEFFVDVDTADGDLLVVVTTRPQGYGQEFADSRFDHLTLEPLNTDLAMTYARRLADVRHHGDDDMRTQTLERVRQASMEPLTARLMRSPLQVTIMFLLLERRARPPQDRHGLFEAYYDTIYTREADKPGLLAQLLGEHRQDVHTLHEQVGLRLQVLAETAGDAEATIPASDLHQLAMDRLIDEGHDDDTARRLAGDIVRTATDRLVLLVPKGAADVGFEVRSLQEYMAARAIVTAPDDLVLRRLRLAAPAVHWRNTWLLAAGRVFSTLEHLRAPVIGLLREIDAESALSNVLPPGPALALELLDDDVAARAPHFRRQLLTHALEQLRDPPADNPFAPARVLLDLSATPDLRALINRAVDQSMAATVEERATIWFLLREWGSETGELAARARQLRHTFTPEERGSLTAWEAVQRPNAPALPDGARRHRLGPQLRDNLQAAGLSGSGQELAQKLVTELDRIVVFSLPPDHRTYLPPPVVTSVPSAAEAVAHPDVAEALALAVLEIPTERWAVSMEIRSILRAALTRQPIGSQLVELTSAAAGE